jgi:hypothetical protein
MRSTRRGGARKSAGRKPILTSRQRLLLGAMIQALMWHKTRAVFDRKLADTLAQDDLPMLWDKQHEARRTGRDKDADAILWDIQAAIDEGVLQGRRYIQGPTKVAAGIREQIIRSVARAMSRRWRVHVSPRMAERCLEEYRALSARADAELADYKPDV